MNNSNSNFHYDIISELGVGTFGMVYKVEDKRTGETFAMKKISKTNMMMIREQITKEIRAIKNPEHPNIVQIKEILMDINHVFIIMEYVQEGCYRKKDDDLIIRWRNEPESSDEPSECLFSTL